MAVSPTEPMISPTVTSSPTSTVGTEARLAQVVVRSPPWSMTTVMPSITSSVTSTTTPEAGARTSVPAAAAISSPAWVRQSAMVTS